jgi:predicted ester cyclase
MEDDKRIREVMESFFAAIRDHDPTALVETLSPECEFVDPGTPEPYDVEGFRQMHQEYYDHFPDVVWDVLHRLIETDGACYVYRCHGTGRGEWPEGNNIEGASHDMVEAIVTKVKDGRIRRVEFHVDAEQSRAQPWNQGGT